MTLSSVKILLISICLYSCSGEIKTENKQMLLDNHYKEKIKEYCPLPGLVGGVERGLTNAGNDGIVKIIHCKLDSRGWLSRIDYYDYNNCLTDSCNNFRLYYSYYDEGAKYKVCEWYYDEYYEHWLKGNPCFVFYVDV